MPEEISVTSEPSNGYLSVKNGNGLKIKKNDQSFSSLGSSPPRTSSPTLSVMESWVTSNPVEPFAAENYASLNGLSQPGLRLFWFISVFHVNDKNRTWFVNVNLPQRYAAAVWVATSSRKAFSWISLGNCYSNYLHNSNPLTTREVVADEISAKTFNITNRERSPLTPQMKVSRFIYIFHLI